MNIIFDRNATKKVSNQKVLSHITQLWQDKPVTFLGTQFKLIKVKSWSHMLTPYEINSLPCVLKNVNADVYWPRPSVSDCSYPHCHTTARMWMKLGGIAGGVLSSSCALLGGFANGARVLVLWQHSAERVISASDCACTRSVADFKGYSPIAICTPIKMWFCVQVSSSWQVVNWQSISQSVHVKTNTAS